MLTDVPGIRVGHWTDTDAGTGERTGERVRRRRDAAVRSKGVAAAERARRSAGRRYSGGQGRGRWRQGGRAGRAGPSAQESAAAGCRPSHRHPCPTRLVHKGLAAGGGGPAARHGGEGLRLWLGRRRQAAGHHLDRAAQRRDHLPWGTGGLRGA